MEKVDFLPHEHEDDYDKDDEDKNVSKRLLTFRHIVIVFWCYKCSVFNSGCSLILFVVVFVVSFVEAKKKSRRRTSKNQSIPEDLGKVT